MKKKMFFSVFIFILIATGNLHAQNATEIIKKADDKMHGITSQGKMTMTVIRPTWSRTVSMKTWSKGRELSLLLITSPAKEKGQAFLKRKNEMWNWLPTIKRMIKIPPSMMMQSWMGSDFTNDDLLKESSVVNDYTHKIIGNEIISGLDCYKIELTPKEDATVVWGKIISWVSKNSFNSMKNEYYDEDNYLINLQIASEIKKMDDRIIPTRIEIIPVEKEGNKTVLEYKNIQFNKPINDKFFSQQNMKRIR
ncbi:MAG: outer membrane lipoprotein-sorting protein [Bacteroidetes bacterium]|nr:outer membrane lipoprotein-sorting protein [Bacteroidota bacterium]